MTTNKKILPLMISAIMLATLLPLSGCNKKTPDQSTTQNTATTPQSVYVPPTADQLYQMVGPIALFPDKLVAQVLAGSSYPDQITAADNWVVQNKNLTSTQLQSAVSQQPWDVSVKGLAMFPDVLDQMAKNLPWTTALGTAYVNDPTDVMNAIQVMRQRASTSGNLKASKQQKITITPRVHRPEGQAYEIQEGEPMVYSGPNVINPPDQTIVIEPADPDVVYVPSYNPRVAYGEPMQVYPGYQEEYEQPAGYSTSQLVTAGALTFGAGIAIAALSHHDGSWNSWGVHWGGHRHDHDQWNNDHDPDNRGPNGGWHRPAVEYNNSTYVSNSTTVVNRIDNNYYNNQNNINIRNTTNNNYAAGGNNRNWSNGNAGRPNFSPPNAQPNFAQQQNGGPDRGQPMPNQPNFNTIHEPHFNNTEIAAATGAVAVGGAALAAHHFNRPNSPQNGNPAAPATTPNFNNPSLPNFGHHRPNEGFNTPNPNANPSPVNTRQQDQQQGWMSHNHGADNGHFEQHQQSSPTAQPQSNPVFEHHQWGHPDQPNQQTAQTPSASQTITPQQQHAPVVQPQNSGNENYQREHQELPHQQAPQVQPTQQPSHPQVQQQVNSAEQHQWGHPSQPQASQSPQVHTTPAPQQQTIAAVPARPEFHQNPVSDAHQWGHPPSQPAPQQQHQPQPTPQAHPNHPDHDKKDENANHN